LASLEIGSGGIKVLDLLNFITNPKLFGMPCYNCNKPILEAVFISRHRRNGNVPYHLGCAEMKNLLAPLSPKEILEQVRFKGLRLNTQQQKIREERFQMLRKPNPPRNPVVASWLNETPKNAPCLS